MDKSGSLSLIEFTGVMLESHVVQEKAPQLWQQLLLECFKDLDVDNRNKIDAANLRDALTAVDSRIEHPQKLNHEGAPRNGEQASVSNGSARLPKASSSDSFGDGRVQTDLDTEIKLAIEDGDTTGDGFIDWRGIS